MPNIPGPLSEQQRVHSISTLMAIAEAVMESGNQEILDVAVGIHISSNDISNLSGIDLEVVHAALDNLSDNGAINVESEQWVDDEESEYGD